MILIFFSFLLLNSKMSKNICFLVKCKGTFHLTELTGQDRAFGKKLYNVFKLTHFEDNIYSSGRMRGIFVQVFLQIVAFSLQNDWSGRPVLTKGKRPRIFLLKTSKQSQASSHSLIFSEASRDKQESTSLSEEKISASTPTNEQEGTT